MNTRTLHRRFVVPLLGSIAAFLPASAADIQKANNTTNLNLGGSWVGGVVPTFDDIAVYDNLITLANTSAVGGNLNLGGIRVTNPTGSVILANTNGTTIALGAGGIDMSSATSALLLEGVISVANNQTWAVANASTAGAPFAGTARQFNNNEDLAFNAGNTTGTGIAFNLNGNTVTTTGAGTIEITSGYTISNGTFNVGNSVFHIQGGASKLTTIASDVTFNIASGSRVFFQSNSGALTSAATVNLNGGTLQWTSNNATNAVTQSGTVNVNAASTLLVANNVANGGTTGPLNFSGNLTGSAPLAINNTATAVNFLRLSGNNSGYTGTATFGGNAGKNTRMTSADAGSAAATWNVTANHTLEIDGVGVQLGTLQGAGTIINSNAGSVASITVGAGIFSGSITDGAMFNGMSLTKVGTGTLVLTGANAYTGNTTVNGGALIAAPGSLGLTNVFTTDGTEFGVRLLSAGTSLNVPGLTVGSSTGATVSFDLGTFGNPFLAPLTVSNFVAQAPTILKVGGSGFTPGTFTLLDYSGSIGGVGLPGLTLALPPRVIGSLSNDVADTSLKVTITGLDTPKWTGAVSGIWDIDDGTGTGTPNWREVNNGTVTRYLQTSTGSDTVLFDDSATGTTNVTLTSVLMPNGITVNNSALTYTFAGTGSIAGQTTLTKLGSGTLRLHNTGANTYSGQTLLAEGTVEVGDGTTPGAGSLGSGQVTNDGTIVLNRPDAFSVQGAVSGIGGLVKNGPEAVTFAAPINLSGAIALNAGTLVFNGGGLLSGEISGAGGLTSTAGTFEIGGTAPNTHTGTTTVSAGNLRFNKPAGVNAVGGNVVISGGATLSMLANEQIADTATLTFMGTSADSLAGSTGTETVARVVANAAVPTGQLIMRNNFTVTDLATLQNGILGVASGHTATVNSVVMSGGILRIAGSAAPSTLNVGPGGITASGGVIEVKFNTNDQDAFLNLNGDFTATANIPINNANYQGFNLSQVVLFGQRTFNIAAGTTTTVRPDVAGAGGLTKTGGGTLDLLGRANSYTGDTVISAGTLRTSTSTQAGTSSITVQDGGTLEVRIGTPGTSLIAPAMTFGTVTGSTTRFDLAGQGNPTAAPLATTNLTTHGSNILSIIGATTAGTFPVIDYSGAIGGSGFGGFTLQLPLRVAGSLINNSANTSVDVEILGVDTPKWNGNVNGTWDIDDGTGTGTANWRGTFTNTATRYLEVAQGHDNVIFDDTATGTTTINLATTLSPASITVDSTNREYTFTGVGKLSGTGGLTKLGAGLLIVANSSDNEMSGPINISSPGAIQLGNGTLAGAGSLGSGSITNDGALIFNRPDELVMVNGIAGSGSVIHAGAGKTTLIGPLTYTGPTTINAGTLALNSPNTLGGTFSIATGAALSLDHGTGTVSGNITNNGTLILNNTASLNTTVEGTGGILVNTGGNKAIGGLTPNTFTGESRVLAGNLTLSKSDGVSGLPAISGDLVIDGGVVTVGALGNQFGDDASITVNTGQILSTFGGGNNKDDTIKNLTINAATPVSTFNGFNITGTLTITAGVQHDAVNSSGTTTANRAVLSNTNIRLGANGGPSTLNIGAGGLSLTNASIVYGSAGNAGQVATVNLNGDVQASGISAFDVNTGNPMSRIDLSGSTRIFNIADGVTTIESSIVSTTPGAGLAKTGPGTLVLAAGSNTNGESNYQGDTTISDGVLEVNGMLSGTNVIVNGGTLSGIGTINPGLSGVVFEDGGKLAPGVPGFAGTLTVNGSVDVAAGVGDQLSGALNFEIDTEFTSDRVTIAGGTLTIGNGVLEFDDFVFTGLAGLTNQTTYTLFDTSAPIIGGLGPDVGGTINGFAAEIRLSDDGTDLVLLVPEPGSAMLLLGGLGMMAARRRRTT